MSFPSHPSHSHSFDTNMSTGNEDDDVDMKAPQSLSHTDHKVNGNNSYKSKGERALVFFVMNIFPLSCIIFGL